MKTLLKSILLATMVLAIANCSSGGGGDKEAVTETSQCASAMKEQKRVSSLSEGNLEIGQYQLQRVTFQFKKGDQSVHVSNDVTYKVDMQAGSKAQVVCDSVQNYQTFFPAHYWMKLQTPNTLEVSTNNYKFMSGISLNNMEFTINEDGKSIDVMADDLPYAASKDQKAGFDSALNNSSATFRLSDGGFVMEVIEQGEGDEPDLIFYAYYKKMETNQEEIEEPVGEIVQPKEPTKEECLERTQIELGDILEGNVRFINQCNTLYVGAAPIQLDIASATVSSFANNPYCSSEAKGYSVKFFIENDKDRGVEYLRELNPLSDVEIAREPSPINSGIYLNYLAEAGTSKMIIPHPSYDKDGDHTVLYFNGAIGGIIELRDLHVCKNILLLKSSSSASIRKKLSEKMQSLFDLGAH